MKNNVYVKGLVDVLKIGVITMACLAVIFLGTLPFFFWNIELSLGWSITLSYVWSCFIVLLALLTGYSVGYLLFKEGMEDLFGDDD